MEISSWAIWALVFVVLINTLFVAGMAAFMFLIWKKSEDALNKAEPLIQKATQTLTKVEQTTSELQVKVDQVLEKTTALVDKVSERVDTTTAIAEEAVTEPLIGAASIMAGINRGLRAYSEKQERKETEGNG